ncbi:GAG-pre-integrase domain-containing protein [Hirsutella rhossiliensis]
MIPTVLLSPPAFENTLRARKYVINVAENLSLLQPSIIEGFDQLYGQAWDLGRVFKGYLDQEIINKENSPYYAASLKKWHKTAFKRVKDLCYSYRNTNDGTISYHVLDEEEDNGLDAFDRISRNLQNCARPTSQDEYEDYISGDPYEIAPTTALSWWLQERHRNRRPKLSRMAIDILSMPAMSDEPERVFSGLVENWLKHWVKNNVLKREGANSCKFPSDFLLICLPSLLDIIIELNQLLRIFNSPYGVNLSILSKVSSYGKVYCNTCNKCGADTDYRLQAFPCMENHPARGRRTPHQRTEENLTSLSTKRPLPSAVGRYLMNYDLLDSKGTTDFARGQKERYETTPNCNKGSIRFAKNRHSNYSSFNPNPAFVYPAGSKPSPSSANTDYPLRNSTLLDSGASLSGYGTVHVKITAPDGSKKRLRLKSVAYCPRFSASLISFQALLDDGIFWDTFTTPTRLVYRDKTPICILLRKYRQFLLEFQPVTNNDIEEAAFQASKPRRRGSRDPRPTATASADLWHARLGHPGPQSLQKLGQRKGVHIRGPKTAECEHCAQGRAYRQVSRRPPFRERDTPCSEIWIDWTDLTPDFEGYVRVMFITDAYSGMVFPYFMRTYREKHNWAALRDFIDWMKLRFEYNVKVIRSDAELFTNKIRKWLRKGYFSRKIGLKYPSPKRGKGPQDEDCSTASPRPLERNSGSCLLWHLGQQRIQRTLENPLELFTKKDQPHQHDQLKAYGCRAYAMTSNAQLKRKRLQKLDPRAYIGYLVGYNSTNIFRIWIPHLKKVISTRDVIFDELTYFDGKFEQPTLLASINELVQRVEIPEDQRANQEILDEESEEEEFDDFEEEEEETENDDEEAEKLQQEEASS